MNMDKNKEISTKYVDVLDGIRAVSVIIVLIFHFWQQTWIFPNLKTPFLSFMGIKNIDFTPCARVGYLFVDMMVLISGVLLFLPVARNIFSGEPLQKWKTYFKKRAVRILPSYVFCVLLLFVYELINGGFGKPVDWTSALRDLILHLTFTQTLTVQTYLSTKLNVVLWTVAIEVWFYILFPLFASFIKRWKNETSPLLPIIRTLILAAVMVGISLGYIYGYVLNTGSEFSTSIDTFLASMKIGIRSSYLATVINQLPAFTGLYAIGMLGSMLYVFAAKSLKRSWWLGLIFTAASIFFIWWIVQLVKECSLLKAEQAQQWQITERLKLSLAFMGFILSASFASKPFRFLFSNKLMVFLSTISYNLYIWHQWLCVKIKQDWRIPYWTGDTPPNQWGNAEGQTWSQWYALIITVAAFLAAILATYLIERPAADLLNGRPSIYNGKLKTLFKTKKK